MAMKVFYLNFMLLWFVSACEPCRYVDCAPAYNTKSVRFASKADSTDLILSGQYPLEAIRVVPLLKNAGDPSPSFSKNSSTLPGRPDYSILIDFNSNTRGYAFQVGQLPPDTLLCLTTIEKSKCCGSLVTLDGLVLNGDTLKIDLGARGFDIYK